MLAIPPSNIPANVTAPSQPTGINNKRNKISLIETGNIGLEGTSKDKNLIEVLEIH